MNTLYRFVLCTKSCTKIMKGPISGLRQYLAIESSFKMMKNTFYFMLKALPISEIFTFWFWLFSYIAKWLGNKAMVNLKIYHVTDWAKKITMHKSRNYSIPQEVKAIRQWNLAR